MPETTIPKIIHFIWAGGTKTMPAASIKTLLAWQAANPSFKVYLWVDKKTFPVATAGPIEHYYEGAIRATAQQIKDADPTKIQLKDIEEEDVSNDCVRHEINQFRPNYGASSDLLRYKILHKFGGAYFDSDIDPGLTSLQESGLFDTDFSDSHKLYVNDNSQNQGEIGNDGLICTAQNPHMDLIHQLALLNYTKNNNFELPDPILNRTVTSTFPEYNPTVLQAYSSDDTNENGYLERMTCNRTGGQVLLVARPVIQGDHPSDTDPIRPIPRNLMTSYPENTRNWVNMPIRKMRAQDAMACAMASIDFEVSHQNILRLDDHISNLIEACGPSVNQQQLIADFFSKLHASAINFSHVKAAQLTLQYPETERFYEQNNLLDKTYVFPLINEDVDTDYYRYMIKAPGTTMPPILTTQLTSESFEENADKILNALNHVTIFFKKIIEHCEAIPTNELSQQQLQRLRDYLQVINQALETQKEFKQARPPITDKDLKANLEKLDRQLTGLSSRGELLEEIVTNCINPDNSPKAGR